MQLSSLCSFLRTLIWPNVPFPSPVVLFQQTFISPPTMPNSFQVHVSLKESDGAEEYDWYSPISLRDDGVPVASNARVHARGPK